GDLVQLERERAQVLLFRDPGGEERIAIEAPTGRRQRRFLIGGQIDLFGRRTRRRERRRPEDAQRLHVGRGRREPVAHALLLGGGDEMSRPVLGDRRGGHHAAPRE